MKKCEICGAKIKKSNNAGVFNLDAELNEKLKKNYKKIQTVCMDCKQDLLYSAIITPY